MFGHRRCAICGRQGHKKDMIKGSKTCRGNPEVGPRTIVYWTHQECQYKDTAPGAITFEPITPEKLPGETNDEWLSRFLNTSVVGHERIPLGPNDVLVLKTKQPIPDKHMDAIQRQVKDVFGKDFKAILLEEDIHVSAVIERGDNVRA